MKKHFLLIFLLVASISLGQSNLERENRFKEFLNSITELKNGYVFTECKQNSSLTRMSGIDYVLLNAVSIQDSRIDFGIEDRLFLGYIKEPTGTIVVITAATRYDSIKYLYSPELMLYSNTGEKLAQINLTRTECLAVIVNEAGEREIIRRSRHCKCSYPNFTIEKNSFIRKYSCVDTIVDGYDDDGQEFIGKKAFPHEDNFKISFDNSGFIITNRNGLIVKGKNMYNGNSYDLYSGEIVYQNRSVYTGQFELDSYEFSASPRGIGEFKNSSGKIVKGKFCGDTTLCVYPKIFLGKFLLVPYSRGDSAEITKDELLNSRELSTSVGKILSFECTFKAGESLRVFSSWGSTFKNNTDFTNNLKQITLGSKIYFELKYRDNIGKIHSLVYIMRVK